MRFDKLTTKFQQALADAQSLALGHDNGFIEPQHLLAALLAQQDGGTASLLARAGVAVPRLQTALKQSIDRLPKVEGTGGEISISRDLNNLLNLTDKEAVKRGDQFISTELFLLALTQDKGDTGRLLKEAGLTRKALEDAIKTYTSLGARVIDVDLPHTEHGIAAYYIVAPAEGHLTGRIANVFFLGDRVRLVLEIDATRQVVAETDNRRSFQPGERVGIRIGRHTIRPAQGD